MERTVKQTHSEIRVKPKVEVENQIERYMVKRKAIWVSLPTNSVRFSYYFSVLYDCFRWRIKFIGNIYFSTRSILLQSINRNVQWKTGLLVGFSLTWCGECTQEWNSKREFWHIRMGTQWQTWAFKYGMFTLFAFCIRSW